MDPTFLDRNVNEGFSGGEKKRNEILQLAVSAFTLHEGPPVVELLPPPTSLSLQGAGALFSSIAAIRHVLNSSNTRDLSRLDDEVTKSHMFKVCSESFLLHAVFGTLLVKRSAMEGLKCWS